MDDPTPLYHRALAAWGADAQMDMLHEEIDELERLLKAATPGEWYRELHPDGDPIDGPNGSDVESDDIAHQGERIAQVGWGPDAAAIVALHNAAPALIAAAREVERLRAFVPVWTPVGNPDGDWRLSLGARELARVCPCGGGRWYPSNAAALDFATIGEAAAAVCARLGIPSVEVGDV